MTQPKQQTVYREKYRPPSFFVESIELVFDLDPATTRIFAKTELIHNPDARSKKLVLLGEDLELIGIRLNGKDLEKKDYVLKDGELHIPNAPEIVKLEVETIVCPEKNTSLMGLYMSNGNFFTQCEAEGFRKITYFPDRPDIMAKYTVTLRADQERYPVLLSNGNLVEKGNLPQGRHYAKWIDPFNKPSYLFAIVAGKLVCQEEEFILASGRKCLLQVWVEDGNLEKTDHAMQSLKHSIQWDEKRFGLELDLERFMIVAVSDFNMGAMENKGLNIFNTRYVLANPRIATDIDYANIESVVAHEYFHNWTGNRVTCRDWFQLSLKEGLTVFRDQEFSADRMGSQTGRAVKRIEDVKVLRQHQFPEDAGAMAHPVRPDSYEEINNFYTVTIYEKGAEVVRMYQTLLGKDGFRKGMDLYFQRHDGQAVTCRDFLSAMADANHRDLSQFERWYSQAGTPRVKIHSKYDAATKKLTLKISQSCSPTPGQSRKQPFLIPIAIGLIDSSGNSLFISDNNSHTYKMTDGAPDTVLLELNKKSQTFIFENIPEKPVISALRNFSAPVILEQDQSDEELVLLLSSDNDAFNRWEAGQQLVLRHLVELTLSAQSGKPLELAPAVIQALRSVLLNESLDPALRALTLTLPTEAMIAEKMDEIDPSAIYTARHFVQKTLAYALCEDLLYTYQKNISKDSYKPEPRDAGIRSLKNLALSFLLEIEDEKQIKMALDQYYHANNMTDRMAALTALVHSDNALSMENARNVLQHFYQEFHSEALVVDKWFMLQATSPGNNISIIRQLEKHPAFILTNPNRARSLIYGFCLNNMKQFHADNGSGYDYWAEQVLALDKINPQVAARLARGLTQYNRYVPHLKKLAYQSIEKVAKAKLSRDTTEILSKILAN